MEMNKYQQAYQNVQAELPVDNEDIVVLRELVDKSISKQVKKSNKRRIRRNRIYACMSYMWAIRRDKVTVMWYSIWN